jgi:hypothetical protein
MRTGKRRSVPLRLVHPQHDPVGVRVSGGCELLCFCARRCSVPEAVVLHTSGSRQLPISHRAVVDREPQYRKGACGGAPQAMP